MYFRIQRNSFLISFWCEGSYRSFSPIDMYPEYIFILENIQREIETICIKKPTKMESRTISQILMISVQKDSPRLQVGPPNQPGRTLCLPLLPHPLILPCSPLLPSIPQSAHSSRQMLLSESEIQIILLILRRGASYCKCINCI